MACFLDSGDATPLRDCHYYSQSREAAFLENLLLSEVIFVTDAPELLLTDLTCKKNTPTLRWMSKVSKKTGCDRGCSHLQHVATDMFENINGVRTESLKKSQGLTSYTVSPIRTSIPGSSTKINTLYTSLESLT